MNACHMIIIFSSVSLTVGYVEVMQNLGQVLATLDCIFALATAAVSAPIPYVRPKLLEQGSGVIKLQEIRHPCLELQDDVSFIPNDCTFDKGLTCSFDGV